jgi:predicted nucleic acid-binding protein
MIVVDTSVWIAHLRSQRRVATDKLEDVAAQQMLLIGDLIMLEILQGARDDVHSARIERALRQLPFVCMIDPNLAPVAAANYRRLRGIGITIGKTADIIIGTFCIEHCHAFLHDDRDFVPMETHLGLQVV